VCYIGVVSSSKKKAVYVSDETHARAAAICAEHGLEMQDWLADLIDLAIQAKPPRVRPRTRARMHVCALVHGNN
jgi:hypothetical protein